MDFINRFSDRYLGRGASQPDVDPEVAAEKKANRVAKFKKLGKIALGLAALGTAGVGAYNAAKSGTFGSGIQDMAHSASDKVSDIWHGAQGETDAQREERHFNNRVDHSIDKNPLAQNESKEDRIRDLRYQDFKDNLDKGVKAAGKLYDDTKNTLGKFSNSVSSLGGSVTSGLRALPLVGRLMPGPTVPDQNTTT